MTAKQRNGKLWCLVGDLASLDLQELGKVHIEETERVGVVHPGEKAALGRSNCGLPVPEGATGKLVRDCLSGSVGTGQGVMGLS